MIDINDLQFIGQDLKRPECVLMDSHGSLHIADWNGGVTVISKDIRKRTILAKCSFALKPNGIAILANKSWLVTHLGDSDGGVYYLKEDGELIPYLLELDKAPLPPTNYVHIDHLSRVWITVSTRLVPRILGCRSDHSDGFIILVDKKGPRIVADNLGYTNECCVEPKTNRLYVNETFGRRLTCFDINDNGSLRNKQTIFEFGFGDFPDGINFDVKGGVWITSIVSNRVIRITPDKKAEIIIEDSDEQHLNWVEDAYLGSRLKRAHLDKASGKALKNVSSLAFGGPDMKIGYLGCLQGQTIATFKSKIAGVKPPHWHPRSFDEIKFK